MNLKQVASTIKQSPGKRVLIAIEGFGGSGKTMIAEELKAALEDAFVVNLDDFIIKEKLTNTSPDKPGFDRARLEQQVLLPVSKNQSATYQRLDWAENELGSPTHVPECKFIIVEGISSYHPDIAGYYDFKIWVDTPIEVATQRGKLKDAGNENEQHWDLWARNDLAYQHKYHPEQNADFVIDNSKQL